MLIGYGMMMEGRCWLVQAWYDDGGKMLCWLVMVWWWREDVDWFKHRVMMEGRCWLVMVWWWREDVDWFKHGVMMEGRCWLVHARYDNGGWWNKAEGSSKNDLVGMCQGEYEEFGPVWKWCTL